MEMMIALHKRYLLAPFESLNFYLHIEFHFYGYIKTFQLYYVKRFRSLKNPSRKIITRDGREVKILYTEANHEYSIIALITNEDGIQFPRAFNKNGEYFHGIDSDCDLFFLESCMHKRKCS